MNTTFLGNALIAELLSDPEAFKQRGRAYQLLDEYFSGLPVETLRPLLSHQNVYVQHAAVWVASELGAQAAPVLDDSLPMITSDDRFLSYHALEIAIVCAVGDLCDRFVRVPVALESSDDVIRRLAMRLMSRADAAQLEAAAKAAEQNGLSETHRTGMKLLAAGDTAGVDDIKEMLASDSALARSYGAVAAKRLAGKHPTLLDIAAGLDDPHIARFVREAA